MGGKPDLVKSYNMQIVKLLFVKMLKSVENEATLNLLYRTLSVFHKGIQLKTTKPFYLFEKEMMFCSSTEFILLHEATLETRSNYYFLRRTTFLLLMLLSHKENNEVNNSPKLFTFAISGFIFIWQSSPFKKRFA